MHKVTYLEKRNVYSLTDVTIHRKHVFVTRRFSPR